MFQSARLKLTAWYVLILMCISGAFSLAMYEVLTNEVLRVTQTQRARFERRILLGNLPANVSWSIPLPPTSMDRELFYDSQRRIAVSLLVINGGVLLASAWLSYFLAGRTLKPIQTMLDQQKRFITDASHELRTPVTALRTSLEIHLRDTATLPQTRTVVSETLEDVKALQTLSEQLLEFGKMEESTQSRSLESIVFGEAVTRAVARLGGTRERSLQLRVQGKSLKVRADKESFIQLLALLLDNAWKHNPVDTRIEVAAQKVSGGVRVSVRDFGSGIDAKDMPHIFERFYRVESSRSKSTSSSGYGLGLSLAQSIAQRHGARLQVVSTLGEGTTFSVVFPSSASIQG